MKQAIRWMVPTLVLILAACSGDPLFPPKLSEVVGTLVYRDPPGQDAGPEIELEVVGRTVSLEIATYGPPCYQSGRLAVEVEGMEAIVTPYDLAPPPDWDCERAIRGWYHVGAIEFPGDGSARILVRGLQRTTAGENEPLPIEIERIVEIGGD